jgi:uncharacterized protein (TIGR02186 family)
VIRALILWLALALPAGAETIVAGLSHSRVSITADFTGEEILVYGAVKREAPVPEGDPLEVVITVEGPPTPVTVRKKDRRYGIWINTEAVEIDRAPSFYAIATTGLLEAILSETENLRHQVTIPRAIRAVGISEQAEQSERFIDALIRIRQEETRYRRSEETVSLTDETLFRADVALPANLTEGDYRVRMFLTRGGTVVDFREEVINVRKEGLERFIHNLAHEQPLLYGLLSLLLAVGAGWGASAAFRLIRV